MALKLISTIARTSGYDNPEAFNAVRVYLDAELAEFIAKPVRGRTIQPECTWHFTDHKDDALGTAVHMLWPLSNDQREALTIWRAAHGRNWKTDLRGAWMRANYGWMHQDHAAALQTLRNTHGPEWLNAYPA